MKIQQFAQLTGLPTKTIRYYETIGILSSPRRTPNGYREYSEKRIWRGHALLQAHVLWIYRWRKSGKF